MRDNKNDNNRLIELNKNLKAGEDVLSNLKSIQDNLNMMRETLIKSGVGRDGFGGVDEGLLNRKYGCGDDSLFEITNLIHRQEVYIIRQKVQMKKILDNYPAKDRDVLEWAWSK